MHYNFDLDLKHGQFGERKLADILTGKIEVKTDFISYKTGNVAVEIECRGLPSGISLTEAPYWAFILWEERSIVIVKTSKLRALIKDRPTIMGGDDNMSKIVLIKKIDLIG